MESKTSYDPPSWISPFFQKRQETMGINIKSSPNAYEMHKFVNLRNLTMKTGKKIQNYLKRLILVRLTVFNDCHGNVKNDGHTIDISKFPQRIKEQLLRVSE